MTSINNDDFVPTFIEQYPETRLPVTEPSERMDPDHDNCSVVRGPELSSVSVDNSNGRAGENQPTPQPNPNTSRLTNRLKGIMQGAMN